jgi:hypothetical protein
MKAAGALLRARDAYVFYNCGETSPKKKAPDRSGAFRVIDAAN